MSKPMSSDDPAYFLLNGPHSRPTIFKQGCYICEDIEFALMGLPLCRKCEHCGGHIAADDVRCDDCGMRDEPQQRDEEEEITT